MSTAVAIRTATELQVAINHEHAQVVGHGNKMVRHAVNCGDLLLEAKETVPHGSWTGWVDEHFEGSEWTSQIYMRLARDERAHPGRITDMETIRDAYRSVVAAKPSPPALTQPRVNPDSPEGRLLANAETAAKEHNEPIEDVEVVELAPAGVDERKWNAALAKLEETRRCMNEAAAEHLTPEAAAQVLQEGSTAARFTAIDLEHMAAATRRRAA